MRATLCVILMAAALALAPAALANPPENPGPPSGTPGGPPEEPGPPSEFPGPGEFPYDPSQHFPSVACQYVPAETGNAPSWVPIPFGSCGDNEEEGGGDSASGSGRLVLLP